MRTISEDIDDLDRMVDSDSAKNSIRVQIRLIAELVEKAEEEHARLAQAYAELYEAHSKLQSTKSAEGRKFWADFVKKNEDLHRPQNLYRPE